MSHAKFKLMHQALSLDVMTANLMINFGLTLNESHAKFKLKRQVLSLDVNCKFDDKLQSN